MIKQNKGKAILSSATTLLPMVFGLIVWNKLPEQVAIHWGLTGEVDGYGNRALIVFGMPLLLLALQWICLLFSRLDPKDKGQNEKVQGLVWWIVPYISLFVHMLVYTTALGYTVHALQWAAAFMGLLFVVIGNYMPKCKQNYTIGIKVVWALENEQNWNATHRFAGKVWVAGGLGILLCGFLPNVAATVMMSALCLLLVVAPIIYSYRYYKTRK